MEIKFPDTACFLTMVDKERTKKEAFIFAEPSTQKGRQSKKELTSKRDCENFLFYCKYKKEKAFPRKCKLEIKTMG